MLKFEEMDSRVDLKEQFADDLDETVILIILFTVDPKDAEAFKVAWAKDAAFFKSQPGYISAQLHQGICGSSMFLDYAVFESVAAFAATTRQPEFGPLRGVYPDSATARLHLFRRVAIPGICVGEAKSHGQPPTAGRDDEVAAAVARAETAEAAEAEVERLRARVAELERRV